MPVQERKRKSAPQNKVKSFVSAQKTIEPSCVLNPEELMRFDAIIASREFDSWSPADIVTATNLAQVESERDMVRRQYMGEGHIIDGKANPLIKVADLLFGQINRTRRDLGLSASQRGIAGHKQAKRNTQDRKAAENVSSLSGLIARPDGKA